MIWFFIHQLHKSFNIMLETQNWMTDLSQRSNILYGTPSYVPLLLEHISHYVQLPGFQQKYIKDIQTMALIKDIQNKALLLVSCIHGRTVVDAHPQEQVTAVLPTSYLHHNVVENNRIHPTKVKQGQIIKVFGSLRVAEPTVLLDIHFILEVLDVESCLRTLCLMTQFPCQKYSQFYHSERMMDLIEEWWNTISKEQAKEP